MNKNQINYALGTILFSLALTQLPALAEEQHYSMDDFYRVPKIDAHMHLHSTRPDFMLEAKRDNFRVLSINVDYADFPPIDEQQRISEILLKEYPSTFAFAATFSVENFKQPGWAQAVNAQLDKAVKRGAVGVKVWKNIGLDLRSADGALVMLDDPRLKPVFDHLEQIHLPLLNHQAEPKNCWLPMAEMSVKNDQEYFASHPQYYMYAHPEMPRYEDLMRARDHMLEQHKNLQFDGVHMASLEWSVDELARFLDRFPHAVVDLAARIGQLQSQANQNPEKVRSFLIKYQDWIMYATDLEQDADAPGGEKKDADQKSIPCSINPQCKADSAFNEETLKVWLRDWRFFNTPDVMNVPELDQPVAGLSLPKAVVDKIYFKNAERFFPSAWGRGNQAQ
ncbi:hypothetical protein AAKU58_002472 [Oxalobacteraceae bacterium GrIS 1.18]